MTLPLNCYLGALWLKLTKGGRLRGLKLKEGGPRHWICRTSEGESWHFRRVRDILPGPLRYVVFLGRFEKLKDREERRGTPPQ